MALPRLAFVDPRAIRVDRARISAILGDRRRYIAARAAAAHRSAFAGCAAVAAGTITAGTLARAAADGGAALAAGPTLRRSA